MTTIAICLLAAIVGLIYSLCLTIARIEITMKKQAEGMPRVTRSTNIYRLPDREAQIMAPGSHKAAGR